MRLEARGTEEDLTLVEFTRIGLEFATWHPRYAVREFDVVVTSDRTARCGITATSAQLGEFSTGAAGADAFDAVERATVLLEMEFNRRVAALETPPTARTRAARIRPGCPRRQRTRGSWPSCGCAHSPNVSVNP